MGLLDKLKKKPKEIYTADFELAGAVYYEEYFWKMLGNNERAFYPAMIMPNPEGYSKYIIKVYDKPIGYFPLDHEAFLDSIGQYITNVQLAIYSDKRERTLGTIRVTYEK